MKLPIYQAERKDIDTRKIRFDLWWHDEITCTGRTRVGNVEITTVYDGMHFLNNMLMKKETYMVYAWDLDAEKRNLLSTVANYIK